MEEPIYGTDYIFVPPLKVINPSIDEPSWNSIGALWPSHRQLLVRKANKPADPAKKAARKRQKKARAINRR